MLSGSVGNLSGRLVVGQIDWSFVSIFRAAQLFLISFQPLILYFLLCPSSVVWWWLSRRTVLSATVALTIVSIQPVYILFFFFDYFLFRLRNVDLVFLVAEINMSVLCLDLWVKDLWCLPSCSVGFFTETAKKGSVVSRANSIGSTSASSVPNTGIVDVTEVNG